MYHIATAKICIVDGYIIPVCALKHKKNLIIMQVWHAMGAIKQFGYQVLDKKEGDKKMVANTMKMHKNYTFITCTSEATKQIYTKAFNTQKEKIFALGMPRIDYLLGKDKKIDDKVKQLLQEYPNLTQKKTIIYVPTFRKGKNIPIQEVIQAINTEKYNLIIRLHPLDESKVDEKYEISSKYTTSELLKIADYVITDYSAITFEASVLNKPIFFYLYDIEEYEKDRGLNIDLKEEMPNETFNNIQDIVKKIENNSYNEKELEDFQKKYIETNDTENTERIVNYLFQYFN